ncbi:MAG: hypothetical protein FWG88_09355 [Oscillospiraceae bacterium]|nr:hypothetical protein [Oscillospiraceae bacterium]
MKIKPAAAKTIGFIKSIRIKRIGRHDGKIGLPKENKDGIWVSPYMESINKAFSQREDQEFNKCVKATTILQKKADELTHEILRHEKIVETLSNFIAASHASDEALTLRYTGEDHLPESGIRARRQQEHDAHLAGDITKLTSSESYLNNAYQEVAKLKAEIEEFETATRLRVEYIRANADERILIYYHAAMKMHPLKDEMPAIPILAITNGEATYLSSRKADIDRIKSMQQIKALVENGGY